MDVFTTEKRSQVMSRIRSKNTNPEIMLRRKLFRLGYRYRICYDRIPGKPDIYLLKHNAAIFINGCFWHGHICHLFKIPDTNTNFWLAKINDNKRRDKYIIEELHKRAIRTAIVWECSMKGKTRIGVDGTTSILVKWLETDSISIEISGESSGGFNVNSGDGTHMRK